MKTKTITFKNKRNLNKDFGKMTGTKIGSKLRIRLPNVYSIPEYKSYNSNQDLKKWCVEQALKVTVINDDGMTVQTSVIETSQEIFDWVTK